MSVSATLGAEPPGSHVDPEAKVWINGDDAEQTGPKLTLDIAVKSWREHPGRAGIARLS